MLLAVKMLVSAALIGVINLVARDKPGVAGALTAFPLVGYLSVVWLVADRRPGRDQAVFLTSMAWALLPTVVVVAAVALLIRLGWHALPPADCRRCGVGGHRRRGTKARPDELLSRASHALIALPGRADALAGCPGRAAAGSGSGRDDDGVGGEPQREAGHDAPAGDLLEALLSADGE
jgi:hypothetical protein